MGLNWVLLNRGPFYASQIQKSLSIVLKKDMAETALLIALKLLMVLICAGWVSLWLLRPTQIWSKKWKDAEERLRPTVLGYYGTII